MNRWNRWDQLAGETKTLGGVVRPFKGWSRLERAANEGNILSDFARNLSLHYNQSSNFNPPQSVATDYFGRPLPKPTGKGRDGGFGFAMFNNQLAIPPSPPSST